MEHESSTLEQFDNQRNEGICYLQRIGSSENSKAERLETKLLF